MIACHDHVAFDFTRSSVVVLRVHVILLGLSGGFALPCDACDNGVGDVGVSASLFKLLPFKLLFPPIFIHVKIPSSQK